MSAEITEVNTLDPDNDFRRIKVEDKFKNAYIDRYRRLGYREASRSTEKTGGKNYAVVLMQRDRKQPEYEKLCRIERQIGELLETPVSEDHKDGKRSKQKLILRIMLCAGLALCAAGLVMLICGFLFNIMALALTGWGVVIVGAIDFIVWSFLRESWRLRKIDIADDKEYPGFGLDDISKKVEEKLCAADRLRGEKSAK